MIRLYTDVAKILAVVALCDVAVLIWKVVSPGAVGLDFMQLTALLFLAGGSSAILLFMAAVVGALDQYRLHLASMVQLMDRNGQSLAAVSEAVVGAYAEVKAEEEARRART